MRPTFTIGHARGVGQHDRHLQDHAELLPDAHRGEVVERLGAVAGLQQERPPGGDLGERLGEDARLAGEHERRECPDLLQRPVERPFVGPVGLLVGRYARHVDGDQRSAFTCKGWPVARVVRKAVLSSSPSSASLRLATKKREDGPPPSAWGVLRSKAGHDASLMGDQAARMRAASSRRPVTARLTRRRAASAVTPSSSPTSR